MEKLKIYQKALELVAKVYNLIENNTRLKKDFSLIDQLKKSAISVVLNIAEGYGRGRKQFKNYLRIASGSANEIIAIFQIIEIVYKINTKPIQNEYLSLAKQISSLTKAFSSLK